MSDGHIRGRVYRADGLTRWAWEVVNTVTGERVAGDDGFTFARSIRDARECVEHLRGAWMRLSPTPKQLREDAA